MSCLDVIVQNVLADRWKVQDCSSYKDCFCEHVWRKFTWDSSKLQSLSGLVRQEWVACSSFRRRNRQCNAELTVACSPFLVRRQVSWHSWMPPSLQYPNLIRRLDIAVWARLQCKSWRQWHWRTNGAYAWPGQVGQGALQTHICKLLLESLPFNNPRLQWGMSNSCGIKSTHKAHNRHLWFFTS